ncbi:hypothetical protein IX51_10905 [uncultured archaeon]|nr:hypothetical protein IX51_10905 [uncultured archaeon]HKJ96742.1 hemerythrin domain-containing protein [Thermoplasmataceae archaeon]
MKSGRSFLDREHTYLLEEMQALTGRSDRFGRLFENVLTIFSYHLDREEETVIPLIDYLSRREGSKRLLDVLNIQRAWDGFRQEYDNMLNEHAQMNKLIAEIDDEYSHEDKNISQLIGELKHHIEIEEVILYPAALAVGELLECRKF